MRDLSASQQAYFAAVRSDPVVFARHAFATIYPGKEFEDNWHIDAIFHALEQNLHGTQPRLIINLPPRHLKSFLISVVWPAFLLAIDPSLKIFCVSYSDDLSKAIARDFKRVVETPWYRAVFPQVRLTKVTENEVHTDQGGYRVALSVHGSITGRGADLIIVDDPCRPEEAVSDKARMAVNEWFGSTLLSRRDDKRRSGLIVVMQRLHVNDLAGYVEDKGGFHKLSFPAIAERDEVIELRNGRTHRRCKGDALQPAREDSEILHNLRDEIGAFNFAAQYQQSPRTPDGQLFKRKYFAVIDRHPAVSSEGEYFISIDSALSTSSTADFTAISIVCIYRRKLYVVRAERGRWDYEDLKARTLKWVKDLYRPCHPVNVFVEAAGSGISLAQYLTSAHDERYHFESCHPRGNKVYRASRVLAWFEMGISIVSVPGRNAWVEPYINEFMNFPNGANDDQVDSLVQLLWRRRANSLLDTPRAAAD